MQKEINFNSDKAGVIGQAVKGAAANVLLCCEESQIVTEAFRAHGFNAFSNDIQDCSGGHPEWHLKMDAFEAIESRQWDLMIAFPPCTDLAVSGAAWFEQKRKDGRQQNSIDFFMKIVGARIPLIAVENPVGIMSRQYRKPDQIVNPWQFGDPVSKKTCLWLKGLPLLKPTNIVEKSKYITTESGRSYPEWCWNTGGGSGKKRSVFFPGMAKAMAEQWGLGVLAVAPLNACR